MARFMLLALAVVCASPQGASAKGKGGSKSQPFVFVSLPDTQVYSENRFPDGRTPAVIDLRGTAAIFRDQTRWIVRNVRRYRRGRRGLSIQYVGHLGDIVQRGRSSMSGCARNER